MTDELEDGMIAKTEQLTEQKQGDAAVAEATELAQIDPKDAIVWFVKGKAHYVDSQYDEALSCFSKAAEIERENPQIWHMMGYCLITLGNVQKAEECLEYVKGAQPDNVEAICALAISQIMQNKDQDARQNITIATALNKRVAFEILEHFHEKYVSLSKETASGTKAMIERALETMKLTR
jgi:Flp pilus assembly protein TadD